VADAHHNRVLRVTRDGDISEVLALGNVVPTGLEVSGRKILVAEAGPVPHLPDDGRVLAVARRQGGATEVARGARLLVDVEYGPGHRLYALSQGVWNGEGEGSPALPDTGTLVEVERDGSMTPVLDGSGQPLVLDRPTSVEFIGSSAYVVSLTGAVVRIDGLGRGGGHRD